MMNKRKFKHSQWRSTKESLNTHSDDQQRKFKHSQWWWTKESLNTHSDDQQFL